MEWLTQEEWQARADAHAVRVDRWVQPHLERRRRGERHPVHDFLFTYYSQRPAALRRWHPGLGVALEGAPVAKDYVAVAGGATPDPGLLEARAVLLTATHRLLVATAGRPPTLGCFGLHEWAMVHRLGEEELRHRWPLRLGAGGTDAVVERHRIGCSHFDAFRFFTDAARPLNVLTPGRDDRAAFEQPGCLHAGMDLYKHAFRLSPLVPSELVADCFELAWEIRELDMRASPYDFADLGFAPVRIETPEGKQQYAAAQRDFAERGAPLRQRLVEQCERLLSASPAGETTVR
ncbi:hypothetical protein [Nocardioides aequoreus]|uniref:hypothetical protein n=1 Tax=Nocardioides aequoreus TaxID=397278 RepID=UPI0004C3065F|nr:hypothetical protein [Nocardioides aequoreus]